MVNHQSCPTQYVGQCLLIDKAMAYQSEGARSGCVTRQISYQTVKRQACSVIVGKVLK